MNIYETRRAQLQRLIDERFGGNATAFAKALNMAPPQIHRWRSTTSKQACRMEWESARSIEAKLQLLDGWMDQPESGEPLRRFTEAEMEMSIRLTREAEDEIGKRFSHADFWRLVKAAAEIISEADHDLTQDDESMFKNMIVKLFTSTKNGESHV